MRFIRTAAAAVSVLALSLSACSTSSTVTPETSAPQPTETAASTEAPATGDIPKGDGTKTIYLVSKGFQHRFWQAVKEGAVQAGTEYNYKVEFVGPDDETKVTQQLDQLQTALDSSPAAIGFAALDSAAAEPVLAKVQAANIPVIAFDSGVDSDIPLTTVQTDNKAAAAEAAKHMAELIGNKGTVGVICHDETSQTGKQRCEGFMDWMTENAPEVKMTKQVAGEVGLAANTAKAMLQADADMVGVYGSNEAAATGGVQGVIESGKTGITVIGFDSGKTQIQAIRDGKQAGAITQSPVKMGYETVTAAIRAINGQELPKIIDSGFAWFDANNIDDPEIAANLYE